MYLHTHTHTHTHTHRHICRRFGTVYTEARHPPPFCSTLMQCTSASWSQDRSIGKVTVRVLNPVRAKLSTPAVGPTQLRNQWLSGSFLGLERPGGELHATSDLPPVKHSTLN